MYYFQVLNLRVIPLVKTEESVEKFLNLKEEMKSLFAIVPVRFLEDSARQMVRTSNIYIFLSYQCRIKQYGLILTIRHI